MSQSTSKHGLVRRGLRTLALVGSALALFHAAPARANNDFQNGFEDQLGRIVATQVYAIGAQALTGVYVPVVAPRVYYAPPVYYSPPVYDAPVIYAPSYGPGYGGDCARRHKVKVRQVVYYRGGGHPSHDWGYRHGRGGH